MNFFARLVMVLVLGAGILFYELNPPLLIDPIKALEWAGAVMMMSVVGIVVTGLGSSIPSGNGRTAHRGRKPLAAIAWWVVFSMAAFVFAVVGIGFVMNLVASVFFIDVRLTYPLLFIGSIFFLIMPLLSW